MKGERFWAGFELRGIPKGQPRPKAFTRGGHAGVYDPGTAGEWKGMVVAAARPHRPAQPLTCPLRVSINFYLPRPKRLCRKKDTQDALPCTSKPDVDNLAKAVLDCMTQDGWWLDDAQVSELHVRKSWPSLRHNWAGASIVVEEL
jgi:Holliday junction resolvase RusA-like endonuclease